MRAEANSVGTDICTCLHFDLTPCKRSHLFLKAMVLQHQAAHKFNANTIQENHRTWKSHEIGLEELLKDEWTYSSTVRWDQSYLWYFTLIFSQSFVRKDQMWKNSENLFCTEVCFDLKVWLTDLRCLFLLRLCRRPWRGGCGHRYCVCHVTTPLQKQIEEQLQEQDMITEKFFIMLHHKAWWVVQSPF